LTEQEANQLFTLLDDFRKASSKSQSGDQSRKSIVNKPIKKNKLGGWLPSMQRGGVFGQNAQSNNKIEDVPYEDGTKSKDLLNSEDN